MPDDKRGRTREKEKEEKGWKKTHVGRNIKGIFKTRKEIRVERFIIEELDRYIKLNKRSEKNLKYIG